MRAKPGVQPLYRRPREFARRIIGALLEFALKIYGAAAATSVALSDAETVGGKFVDALRAPTQLKERYEAAQYAVEHREEIRSFLDYVHQNAPDASEVEAAVVTSSETLGRITTTYAEITQARETLLGVRPNNFLQNLPRVRDHIGSAWSAKPDLDSLAELGESAQAMVPLLARANALDIEFSRFYENTLLLADNFAHEEVWGTLSVMVVSFAFAYGIGKTIGFWARRGRPGLIASILQRVGFRVFRGWYVRNLEHALGNPMYAIARERVQKDILMNPADVLDPEALDQLEVHFERRRTASAAGA